MDRFACLLATFSLASATVCAEPQWQTLPSPPTPGELPAFLAQITRMWEAQPDWTADELSKITVPTWIVDGDHDEMIRRENTECMAPQIPDAGLLLQPEAS